MALGKEITKTLQKIFGFKHLFRWEAVKFLEHVTVVGDVV